MKEFITTNNNMETESEALKMLRDAEVIPISYDKECGLTCRNLHTATDFDACVCILRRITHYKFTFDWNDIQESLDYINRYKKSKYNGRKILIRDVNAYIKNEYRLYRYENDISDYKGFSKEEFYEKVKKDLKKAKFKIPNDKEFKKLCRDVRRSEARCYWINNKNRDEFLRSLKLDLNKQRKYERWGIKRSRR